MIESANANPFNHFRSPYPIFDQNSFPGGNHYVKKRSGIIGIILAVAAVAAVFYAEQVLQPVYAVFCHSLAIGSILSVMCENDFDNTVYGQLKNIGHFDVLYCQEKFYGEFY